MRIECAIYVIDKIIRNLDCVAVINSIFGHGYCPQYGQQPGVFRSSNMYDSPFQVTKFDRIHVSHVAVLLFAASATVTAANGPVHEGSSCEPARPQG